MQPCCSAKAISIAYSEFLFVAFGIQHAMLMRHIVICSLPAGTLFFSHYLMNGTIFGKESY